ncbi:conserved hypothetical protein [Ricinus communis]|uniref:Uncharacterized protein n=1 Tax=Ricinus communis TaxID=3988 RepID=B9TAP4_RICCO|nr:conserved hypothetical protein [Ricinus communis]EEF27068.1 conserved hypothetical protein [Ricinus communis]
MDMRFGAATPDSVNGVALHHSLLASVSEYFVPSILVDGVGKQEGRELTRERTERGRPGL